MKVFISFIRINGELFFQYSFSEHSCIMQDFKNECPDCETIEVFTDKEEFLAEDAYDYLIENGK